MDAILITSANREGTGLGRYLTTSSLNSPVRRMNYIKDTALPGVYTFVLEFPLRRATLLSCTIVLQRPFVRRHVRLR